VTNIPQSVTTPELESLFSADPGFERIRTVRNMIFVDFYDARFATSSMRLHQNHKFQAHFTQGIMVDYDKDPRNKRNKALTGQLERGCYTRGLDAEGRAHPPRFDDDPVDAPVAVERDLTLELINKLKRDHALSLGVEVALHAGEWTHLNYQQQRQRQNRDLPVIAMPARIAVGGGLGAAPLVKLKRKKGKAATTEQGSASALEPPPSATSGTTADDAIGAKVPCSGPLMGLVDYGSDNGESEEE
jgi:hypothetical protein